jgi:hypothetical protein
MLMQLTMGLSLELCRREKQSNSEKTHGFGIGTVNFSLNPKTEHSNEVRPFESVIAGVFLA